MPDKPVILAWSGGKDSALTFHQLIKTGRKIAGLLTTVTEGYDRISMHGVRRSLLERQAKALGCPLNITHIPQQCGNEEYEKRMAASLEVYLKKGIETVAFGDLFLEDIRAYRENQMKQAGMKGLFPIWDFETHHLARQFIESGFRAVLVCVDTEQLSRDFAGREYDEDLLRDLPEEVDPCGENGEFHTFVYDGPIFDEPVRIKRGEELLRDDRFMYCDLLSA
jgi:uncharacterized protein (TIGR00290 family)